MTFDHIPGLTNGANRRVYVLDTNVLLHDPSSLFRFDEHIVMLPLLVLEEIDAKKNDPGIGYNAREISQKLEHLLQRDYDPGKGVAIPNGRNGWLFLTPSCGAKPLPLELQSTSKDNVLLAEVMGLQERLTTIGG